MNKEEDIQQLEKGTETLKAELERMSKRTPEEQKRIDEMVDSLKAAGFKKVDNNRGFGGPGCSACRNRGAYLKDAREYDTMPKFLSRLRRLLTKS